MTLRGRTASYNYDLAGRLSTRTLPNGIQVAYQYDDADRVTSIAYAKADNTLIESVAYAYDRAGRRIQKEVGSSGSLETLLAATYDEANRLTSVTLNGEPFALSYDDNGNLISKVGQASGATTYTWDARNRLSQISGAGVTAQFRYDAFGRRIERTVNASTTGYLYDGAQAIAELTSNAVDTVYHTGMAIDEVLARYGASGNRTLLSDALMSVIAQANDDQSIGNFYAYTPYGETTTLGPDEGNPIQYTGRENDQTGLYYYRARYYDPVLKRFIAEDPIGLGGGINVYGYAGGNPVLYVDPRGTLKEIVILGIAALALYKAYDIYGTARDAADATANIAERFANKEQYVPPPGKSWIDINPNTGNYYVIDEQRRSERDLFNTASDLSNIGRGITEQALPGPEDALKACFKYGICSCKVRN